MPHLQSPLLAGPLQFLARAVVRAPKMVLALSLVLAAVCILAALQWMGFHSSRLDLLNPESAYNQRWIRYLNEFGNQDDAVVVIEGPNPQITANVADELAAAIQQRGDLFQSVMHNNDLSRLQSKALHLAPLADVQRIEAFIARHGAAANDENTHLAGLAAKLDRASPQQREQLLTEVAAHVDGLLAALRSGESAPAPSAMFDLDAALGPLRRGRITSSDERIAFVLLRFAAAEDQLAPNAAAVRELRQIIADARARHLGVSIGLTGMPVLEYDEMRASQQDMARASLLSLLGVACLFVAGFGGLRYPLMTICTLLVAIAWTCGYIVVSVGHLNILSVSFGVILIGLGIDFGIHYVARYLQLRKTTPDCTQALVQTSGSVGPGIVTGGATTAIAFCTAGLTDFTGIAELGIIAGGGVLLCVAAALVLLPALIFLADRRRSPADAPQVLPAAFVSWPSTRFPRAAVIGAVFVTALASLGAMHLRYDHNLLNLQADGLESVEVEKKILRETNHSVWCAVSIADSPAEIRRRKELFRQLECVDRIEEIASLLPEPSPPKQQSIARINAALAALDNQPPGVGSFDIRQLDNSLAQLAARLPDQNLAERTLKTQIAMLRESLATAPPDELAQRVAAFQRRANEQTRRQLAALQSAADPNPPILADLPAPLVDRFVGAGGQRHLMRVYARGDIWDMDALARFVAQTESIDPHITGHPIQTYYASRQMQRSYVHAAVYALLAVLIALVLDFGSVRHALLATLPMSLGLVLLFGLLGACGIPLNPANMIVLPLILGIGIDDGVHVMHDFRRQEGEFRLSNSTAMAILLTSATTMVGFGSLMSAKHQGLRSLGQVITLGVFCCLATSIIVLPALLRWLSTSRQSSQENAEPRAPLAQPRRRAPAKAL